MTSEYITLKEIAESRKVSRQYIDKCFRNLKLPYRKFGKTIVLLRTDAEKLLNPS